jgi:hypothetical protein
MIYYYLKVIVLAVISCTVYAHQFIPTYPELETSYVSGVVVAKMQLFNRREDVQYYEIEVFDKEWQSIPFTSMDKIINVKFLETKRIDVYIREKDKHKVTYICSKSKLKKENITSTIVSSRICSKIK